MRSHLDLSLAARACFTLIALLIIKVNSIPGPLSAFLNMFPKTAIPDPWVCTHICNMLLLLFWGVELSSEAPGSPMGLLSPSVVEVRLFFRSSVLLQNASVQPRFCSSPADGFVLFYSYI